METTLLMLTALRCSCSATAWPLNTRALTVYFSSWITSEATPSSARPSAKSCCSTFPTVTTALTAWGDMPENVTAICTGPAGTFASRYSPIEFVAVARFVPRIATTALFR